MAPNTSSTVDGYAALSAGATMRGELCTALCLAVGAALLIYQSKKTNKRPVQKDPSGKTLDDYQYRDLFHFFINPEFHSDKYNLAKGSFGRHFATHVVTSFSSRIQ